MAALTTVTPFTAETLAVPGTGRWTPPDHESDAPPPAARYGDGHASGYPDTPPASLPRTGAAVGVLALDRPGYGGCHTCY